MRPRRRAPEPARPVVQQARINEGIRSQNVRLVDEDGAQIGIKSTKDAMDYAFSKNLDLVEVAAQADPPVARVMDYGKYRYEQEQKAKLAEYRVEVDDSDDTVGKRIRNAEVEKIPYVIVFGDKESDESLAVREHGGNQRTVSLSELQRELATLAF